jgi:predicted lipoprotein with Yx(FWY)xxD motif
MLRAFVSAAAIIAAQAVAAQDTVTLEVSESEEYGQFLTVGALPVYLFSTDIPGNEASPPTITCIGECLSAWPPVVGTGVEAGDGVDADLLGTVEVEGIALATYNGWPLYVFLRDTEGGPPTGQEIESFGGEWYLVSPDGNRIEGEGV